MSEQTLGFVLLILGGLLALSLGLITGQSGGRDRERDPWLFWSGMAVMALFMSVGLYRLIAG